MTKAGAKTLLKRNRSVGEKTGLPRISEISPKLICAHVQDEGYFFISYAKLEALYVDGCESQGIAANADFEDVLPHFMNRIRAGINQRQAIGDVPQGHRYATESNHQRGRYNGFLVTLAAVSEEVDAA